MILTTNLETFLAISLLLLGTVSTATGKIIYVDANAVGANDGSSWADAYWCLQDALAVASSGTEIRLGHIISGKDPDTRQRRQALRSVPKTSSLLS
ncbi:MAG: hypothetical protein ACYTDW_14845 [Planctomycetota bacterium]